MSADAILIGSAIVFHGITVSVALIVNADRLGGLAVPLNSTSIALARLPSRLIQERDGSSQKSPSPDTSRNTREEAIGYTRQSTSIDRAAVEISGSSGSLPEGA